MIVTFVLCFLSYDIVGKMDGKHIHIYPFVYIHIITHASVCKVYMPTCNLWMMLQIECLAISAT